MEKMLEKSNLEERDMENPKEETKFKKVEMKQKNKEKVVKKMKEKNSKKKWIKPAIAIAVLIVALLVVSTIFALMNMNSSKILSGISIQNIEMSGLSKEEAKAKLQAMYEEKKQKEISVKYQEYETTLNPTLMEVNYNIDKAVEEAYLIGRESNIFVNNYNILYTLLAKKEIPVEMTLNEEVTKQTIEDIGTNLPGIVIESSYSREEDELIITKGKEGVYIDIDTLCNKIKQELQEITTTQDFIEIPVVTKSPETINIEKIHQEVCTEAKDAYYTKDPFEVHPEVEGVDFDLEEAKAILAEEGKEEYIIKLKITKPKVTISQIGTEAFPDRLAIFTTRYDASDTNRTTNLKIACQKINEKVILAGETFSYNKTLGPRTAAAGYRNGKVYENGAVVDGIGGGICQISSTLYNAVLMANLEIVERRNHQFVTSYVPAGRDATVVYGMTDFKFKNSRKYPVRIVASCSNGIATVSVYGIKEENEYTVSFSTKTIASIPYTTKYVEDASLAVGEERVKQKGTNGLKTETYMTKSLNGKVISTQLLSKDTYDPMVRIIHKGKGSSTTSTNPSTNNVDTNTNASTNANTSNNQPVTPQTTPQTPNEKPTGSEATPNTGGSNSSETVTPETEVNQGASVIQP